MSQLVAQSESPDPSFQRRPESIVDHRTPSFKAAELHEPLAALLRRCLEMSVADFTQKFFLSQSTAPDMKNMGKYSRALCHCEGARASKEGEVEEEEEGVVGRKAERGGCHADTLTVGVGTDEDPDAAAGGDVVRRQGVDVAADGRPAQRRLPRAGLPAPHSRRPHRRRLPAWLYTRTERREGGGHVSTARDPQAGTWKTHACLRADSPDPSTHTHACRER